MDATSFNERGRIHDPAATEDDRLYAAAMHLSLLAHLVISFFAVLIPIIMWQVRKNQARFINDHGRECVNFQITLLIYAVLLPLIAFVLGVLTCGVGFVLVPIALAIPYVLGFIGMIMAALAAKRGELFRYPMTIRMLGG